MMIGSITHCITLAFSHLSIQLLIHAYFQPFIHPFKSLLVMIRFKSVHKAAVTCAHSSLFLRTSTPLALMSMLDNATGASKSF